MHIHFLAFLSFCEKVYLSAYVNHYTEKVSNDEDDLKKKIFSFFLVCLNK